MGVRQLGAVFVLVASVTACSRPFVAPTTLRECYGSREDQHGGSSANGAVKLASYASTDAISIWTQTYSEEKRPLGSTGTIYLCVPDDLRGRVTTTELSDGVAVDRVSIVVGDGTDLPFPELHVTVTGSVDAPFRLTYDYGAGGGDALVHVDVDGDEWSFEKPSTSR